MSRSDLRKYLSVPYLAVVYSVQNDDGEWLRRAEYPELPGCVVEVMSADEALERLDEERVHIIAAMLARGEEPPMPRLPLRSGVSGLSSVPLEALVEQVIRSVG